jgi:glycerophosphoryl diester phosphodiesterase
LDWAHGRVLLNIEIKSIARAQQKAELRLLNLLRRFGVRQQCLISSFNPLVLRRIGLLDPGLPTGLLLNVKWLSRGGRNSLTRLTNIRSLHISKRLATPRFLEKIHSNGLRVLVWGTNKPADLKMLVDYGVDGIITDAPQLLTEILERKQSQ